MVQSHRPNIELIAAQALGTAIGIKLSTPVITRLEAYHAKPAATLTRRERQAEPSEKPTVKQPTLFNQRYSKSSLKTKALADTANGFSTRSPEEASLLKLIGAEDVYERMQAWRRVLVLSMH